jgi:hypothetical protein
MLEYDMFITPENNYIVLDLKHRNKNHAQAAVDGTKAYITSLKNLGSITSAVYKDSIKELNEIEKQLHKKIKVEEKLDELKDIKEEEQIFLRRLPKDAKSLQKVTESDLSAKTRKNLEILAENYNITWSDYYRYSISQDRKIAHGYIVVNDRKDINYFRTETKSPGAGQTNIYYDGKTVQMTRLLKDDNYYIETKTSFKEFNIQKSLFERNRNASLHSAYRTQKV